MTDDSKMRKDCRWGEAVEIEIPGPNDNITDFKAGFLYIYTYPFTLGLDKTAAITSGSNPDIEWEDDEGSPLRRRTRSSARDLQAPRPEAAESGTTGSDRDGEQRVLEEDADAASARRAVGIDPEGLEPGAFQERGSLFGEIGDPNDFIQNFLVLSVELRDAERMIGATVRTLLRGGDFIANIFDGCKETYDHAILRLRGEHFCHKKEHNNVASKLQDSEVRHAQRDKELGELRTALGAALREKAALVVQVEQSSSWISQLEAEIFRLKEQNEIVTGELATSRDLLLGTRREMVTLATAKSEAKRDAASYREDATMAHTMVCDMSTAAEKRLIRAIENAKEEVKRETLEELDARGFDLSTDLEEAHAVEGRLALPIAPNRGAESLFEARSRSGPPKEEERLLAPGSRNTGKRKDALGCEKACHEVSSSQRLRGSDSADRQSSGVGASSDVASAFGKAQRFGHMAFDRLKAKLLHYEAPLRVLEIGRNPSGFFVRQRKESSSPYFEGKTDELEQLWGKVGKAKREFIKLQAHVKAHSKARERAQTGPSTLEAQIQAAHENDSAREKMIVRLSSELSRAKTEAVNVRAKVAMNNTRARQKMAAYSRSAVAAKAELQKTPIVPTTARSM
ncbi:uncharacterized protein [Nicotiana sylvestris]|uniref:uncharacterized protein n=1 Tax=Nicotiana sylvestris TaxID=4096 RepID=UPI00388C8B29